MSKSQKNLDNQTAFNFADSPDPTEILIDLKQALTKAITKSRKSRQTLATHLSKLSDKEVTVAMINSWTAESKNHIPPIQYLLPICVFCNDYRPLAKLLSPYGLKAIDGREQLLLKHGELFVEESDLEAKKSKLTSEVRRMFFKGSR